MSSVPNAPAPEMGVQSADPLKEAPAEKAGSSVTALSPAEIHWGMYTGIYLVQPHEEIFDYVPGGYHPVHLGETFKDGRYIIKRKLGFGGQSTVWLAFDSGEKKDGDDTPSWVAIKIKTASCSQKGVDGDTEVATLRRLEEYYLSSGQEGPRPFVRLFDAFQHTGPNGTHTCIVTEVLGPTVGDLVNGCVPDEDLIPPDMVLRMCRQVLEGLQFVHQAGFAHGDLCIANLAFTCKNATEDEDANFLELVGGEPRTAPYNPDNPKNPSTLPPGMPRYLVKISNWDAWYPDRNEEVRFIDWGWSFPVDETATMLGQPTNLRPPETFLFEGDVHTFSYKHDLWRAGSVLYSLFYQRQPFSFVCGSDCLFIGVLVSELGPLPPVWNEKWQELMIGDRHAADTAKLPQKLIQDTFEPRRQEIIRQCNAGLCEYEFDEHSEYDLETLKRLLPAILGLMQHVPDNRMSLQEALSLLEWTDYRLDGPSTDENIEQ